MIRLLALIGSVVPFALAAMLVLIYWGEEPRPAGQAPAGGRIDLLGDAVEAMRSGRAFECDEAALNDHFHRVLEIREADGFEVFAEFEGLWLRLLEGEVEVILERDFLGLRSTVAARVEVAPAEGGHQLRVVGGRFGRLPAPPGAMHLLRAGLTHLSEALAPEKGVLSDAGAVTLSTGRLRLDPRPSALPSDP